MALLGNRSRADLGGMTALLRDARCQLEATRSDRDSTDPASRSEVLTNPGLSENPVRPQPTTRTLQWVVLIQSNQSDIARVRKVETLGPARTRFRRAR
jgi:hypothetical protein